MTGPPLVPLGAITIDQPWPKQYHSRVNVTPNFTISSERPLPNPWRRFWYWALLGWKWEAL